MIERDYLYCKALAEQEGWTLNYLVRRICNRFVTTHMEGQEWGVMPPPLEEGTARKKA